MRVLLTLSGAYGAMLCVCLVPILSARSHGRSQALHGSERKRPGMDSGRYTTTCTRTLVRKLHISNAGYLFENGTSQRRGYQSTSFSTRNGR